MSKPRMILTFTAAGSAAFLAAFAAVWMFPMQAPAQTTAGKASSVIVADGPGITVDLGAKILHRTPVFYPSGVTATGDVVVETSVDTKGEVTDARIVSGPQELRGAVLRSVLGWHFSTDGGLASVVQSTIHFISPPKPAQMTVQSGPVHPTPGLLKAIDTSSLPADLAEKVQAAITIRPGSPFGNAEMEQVREAVTSIDSHFGVGFRLAPNGDTTVFVTLPGTRSGVLPGVVAGTPGTLISGGVAGGVSEGVSEGVSGGVSLNAPNASNPPSRIRVGGNAQSSNLIKKVTPMYPPDAKAAGIQGTVRFTATIGKDGTITNLELVSGHPLLVESAQSAVSQWVYRPTLLNGNPVEVVTQIDVNFTLTQ